MKNDLIQRIRWSIAATGIIMMMASILHWFIKTTLLTNWEKMFLGGASLVGLVALSIIYFDEQ